MTTLIVRLGEEEERLRERQKKKFIDRSKGKRGRRSVRERVRWDRSLQKKTEQFCMPYDGTLGNDDNDIAKFLV